MRLSRTIALAAAVFASSTHADTVFSKLPPSGGYSSSYVYASYLFAPDSHIEVAWQFTPSATGELNQMRSALFVSPTNTPLALKLYADAGGIHSAELASWTIRPPTGSGPNICWTFPLSPSPLIHADTPYFISVRLTQSAGSFEWWCASSPPGPNAPNADRPNGVGAWASEGTQAIPAIELSISHCGSADFNHDGDTATDTDIEAFFRVLAGGAC